LKGYDGGTSYILLVAAAVCFGVAYYATAERPSAGATELIGVMALFGVVFVVMFAIVVYRTFKGLGAESA
jgi:heme/copper-type cytochrome/quinol oxidase subunit 3